jgi:hypothetical protein
MTFMLTRLAPVLAAGAAAAAIIGAPIASAATDQTCTGTGGGTVCQSPGNVQLDDSPAPAQFSPYGDEAFLLGDGFGGAGFDNGFHGAGGFGGGDFGGGAHGGHR